MKRIVSLLLVFALVVTCTVFGTVLPTTAATGNLLAGGDFEDGGSRTNWEWTGASETNIDKYAILGGTSPMTIATEEDGNHCLKIPAQGSNGTYSTYDRYCYKTGAERGKTYRLTLRYKGSGLRLYFHSTHVTVGSGGVFPPDTTEWTTYSHIFTANTETFNYNFLFAIGHKDVGGTVYVDDIALTEYVAPTGIGFVSEQITMGKSATVELPLSATPDGATMDLSQVEWTSSNTAAVTVANGVATAVDYGVSYVTATLGEYSATCIVIVDPYTPVTIGDFEGTLSGSWAWDHDTYGIVCGTSPMSVKPEGTNSYLEIPSTGAYYVRYYRDAPVMEGRTYVLKFRYKGDGLRINLPDNVVTEGNGTIAIPTATGWTTYEHTFTVRTETLANKNFIFSFGHSGKTTETACLDDVTLCEVSPINDLIVDGDLENETLSDNWKNFVAASPKVELVDDPADPNNKCWKYTQAKSANYFSLKGYTSNKWYKLTYKAKGTGRVTNAFPASVYGQYTVYGTDKYEITNNSSGDAENVRFTPTSEWKEYSIVFQAKDNVTNINFVFYLGSLDNNKEVYYDDISLVEVGNAMACEGLNGGSVAVDGGTTTGGKNGQIVTATVTAKEGYLMVPGSLRYVTTSGFAQRILNKDTTTFGEGAGNTFAFVMPNDNVRILADFVKTDTTDFAWGTVGTAVHRNGADEEDGIRFLTRVNTTAFDPQADAVYYNYEGVKYQLKELGLLLKRSSNEYELTYENAEFYAAETSDKRIWKSTVYTKEKNTFHLTDYTGTYLDYTITMTTGKPNEEFNDRLYSARGYMVLEKDGEQRILYANERTDSVNTTLKRMEGKTSDGLLPDDGGAADPVEPDITIPKDDKDYSNADLKILSIGNSYSQDAQKYLSALAKTQGKTFKCVNLYKSGCALKTHYEAWVNNEAIYDYELNGVHDDSLADVNLKAVLKSDTFDVVTFQSSSWQSVNYKHFQPHLNELIAAVRKYQPNATIYIHQTWSYADGYSSHNDTTGGTMEAMWLKVESAYNQAAAETGLSLIPSGQAVMNAQIALNNRGLGESIHRDGTHVSYTWGRYLLARVWYETLTGDTPNVTLSQLNSSVSNDTAMETLVKQAAADAFAEYRRNPVMESVYEWQTHPQDYKLIAFGFDDLPTSAQNTTSIINTFAKYEGFATCFVLGENIEKSGTDLLEYAVDKGFEIGNHSYNHPRMTELSYDEMTSQLQQTNTLLQTKMGITPKFFRPPYLATNADVFTACSNTGGLIAINGNKNSQTKTWYEVESGADTAKLAIQNAYDGAIYVMHPAKADTAAAMEEICQTLYNQGYRFCTMSQLFAYKGITPQYNKAYSDVYS